MQYDFIVSTLRMLNFTESEVKTYIALLQNGSSSGYQLSKVASIPRSKIYVILEALITKGLVVCSKFTGRNLYEALPAEEALGNLQRDFSLAIDAVKRQLSGFNQRVNMGHIWQIRGYKNVFNKCREILHKTTHEVYVQIWHEDFDELAAEFIDLEKKGIQVVVILYCLDNSFEIPLGKYYCNELGRERFKEFGGRWVTLVSDSKEMVFGQILNKNTAEVVWAENLPLVSLAKGYVKNDVYFSRTMPYDKPGWYFSLAQSTSPPGSTCV